MRTKKKKSQAPAAIPLSTGWECEWVVYIKICFSRAKLHSPLLPTQTRTQTHTRASYGKEEMRLGRGLGGAGWPDGLMATAMEPSPPTSVAAAAFRVAALITCMRYGRSLRCVPGWRGMPTSPRAHQLA